MKRSRIAVEYSLIFCYCIVVSSADADHHSEGTDQMLEGGNNHKIGISLRLPVARSLQTHSSQGTHDNLGNSQYTMNIGTKYDVLPKMSEQLDRLFSMSEQQQEQLGLLKDRYTKLEGQTQSISDEMRKISMKINGLDRRNSKMDTVVLEGSSQHIQDDMSSISNGDTKSCCDKHSTSDFEMGTEDKLEELKNSTIPETFSITKQFPEYEKTPPADCWDVLQTGYNSSDIYEIRPSGTIHSFNVYCDMETRGGGWTVFQNRKITNTGRVNFTRKWREYKLGFGDLQGDFWLGLENVHQMTKHKPHELMIEVKDDDSMQYRVVFDQFAIGSEIEDYQIKELGNHTGNAGGCIPNVGKKFLTIDSNVDQSANQYCVANEGGGWWYECPYGCNLNEDVVGNINPHWLYESRMSIRPRN